MSEVSLPIGGRTYRVACAAGEEERVTRLGATIADKLASMGNPTGPDAQNLLFAALLLADEVHEGREGVAAADDKVAAARREADTAGQECSRLEKLLAARDAEIARLQAIASEVDAAHARIAEEAHRAATLEAEARQLRAEIADLRAAPAATSGGSGMAELAPALERFAEMLEECADKLERRAPAP